MGKIYEIDHPLVQHKVSILRNKGDHVQGVSRIDRKRLQC